ncbi:phthiocerol/phthiodiolone dimycocerosyl transferase family protein [Nocardia sp. CA-128927]|uniref:phthiocerol/phthiodiolone dimycocerosyl transferase family protein n=1 Tax=Nocardia sp. CA-128927 TaxID=3239975 RepID=UPI003D974CFD
MTVNTHVAGQERQLGELEKSFALRRMALKYATLAIGRLDLDRLRAAFVALTEHNPVLYSRIRQDGEQYALQLRAAYAVPVEVHAGDPHAFLHEPVRPLDQSEHVARLEVVQHDATAAVAITLNHVVADGNAALALLAELWSDYTALTHGIDLRGRPPRAIPVGPQHLLDPADTPPLLLPDAEFLNSATHLNRKSSLPRHTIVSFTPEQSAEIVDTVHTKGVTVHAAVSGAVLAAERSLIDEGGPVPMLSRCSVDFRALLPTPIPVLDITNAAGIVLTGQFVDRHDAPLMLGQRVTDDIRARVADRRAIYSSLDPVMSPEMEADLPPISYISNVGRIPPFETPADLSITDMGFGGLGQATNWAMYTVSTYDRQLKLAVTQPADGITEDAQQELVAGIVDRLRTLH